MGLNDTEDSVVMDTKSYLLPVVGFWAATISHLQGHLLMNFLQKTVEAIQVGQKCTFCFYQFNHRQIVSEGLSSNFASNIKEFRRICQLLSPMVNRNLISGGIGANEFASGYINPNLDGRRGVGEGVILPPCWFCLNNSETAKAVTLAFCSIW